MNEDDSSTYWIDEPIKPEGYDLETLIPLARRARRRMVGFDWRFGADDIRQLQAAAFRWGTENAGRYKCFSARILASINAALGESEGGHVVREPKNGQLKECSVTCRCDAGSYHLCGTAPFDVVFGYGMSALASQAPLGSAVRNVLSSSVGMLGWDLHRLNDETLRPVRNALYNLPLDCGCEGEAPFDGPSLDLSLHFKGPFTAHAQGDCSCLFTDDVSRQSGIYLWTIEVNGIQQPWYVGQTRRGFGQRMAEHIASFLSGAYTVYDVTELAQGRHRRLSEPEDQEAWPWTIPAFLRDHESLLPHILGLLKLLRFHAAPLTGDANLHNRVEGIIGRYFKQRHDPSMMFGPGIKLPSTIPYGRPIRLVLTSDASIAGLPATLDSRK